MCATLMPEPIIFAIPKGRILDEALPLLARVGIEPAVDFFDKSSRALVFATNQPHISLIRVRAFDVATFVAHGAAQMGIVGSDVIDEFDYSELYAPVDLGIGHCRLSLAGPADAPPPGLGESHIRVATKYPATTRRWFAAQTLVENALAEQTIISDVSARLIVNRAAFKLRSAEVPALVERFRQAVGDAAA